MSKIQETLEEWNDLEPKKKIFLGIVALCGVLFIVIHALTSDDKKNTQEELQSAPSGTEQSTSLMPQASNKSFTTIPSTNRNQGLEDMEVRLDKIESLIKAQVNANGTANPTATTPATTITTDSKLPPSQNPSASINLDQPLNGTPENKIDFNEEYKPPVKSTNNESSINLNTPATQPPPPMEMKVWGSKKNSESKSDDSVSITIPVNSGLDAIMLSGVNARQPGASTGAAGASTSALNVGAPFVTRLKGNAILPNGWKLSDLGDCFLGGSAVAILSTERANAIADTISCIAPNGEVWEAPVKAYALDVDGTLGIAGKVVSKQGSILMQAALSGMASGLGSALAPTAITGYNSNATSGSSQGYQLPDATLIAGTAVGQGISSAAGQLSKFYLDFAREIFPVVEVTAGTRVTWILKESIELKKSKSVKVTKK